MVDKNDRTLKKGDVFDIHQTVNGQSEFFVASLEPLDIRYNYDRSRKYEYNAEDLFKPCKYSGEVDFEII